MNSRNTAQLQARFGKNSLEAFKKFFFNIGNYLISHIASFPFLLNCFSPCLNIFLYKFFMLRRLLFAALIFLFRLLLVSIFSIVVTPLLNLVYLFLGRSASLSSKLGNWQVSTWTLWSASKWEIRRNTPVSKSPRTVLITAR